MNDIKNQIKAIDELLGNPILEPNARAYMQMQKANLQLEMKRYPSE
jgi:hypothetical protein